MDTDSDLIIDQTKKWIRNVVIGCNFCPFASVPFSQQTIAYKVDRATEFSGALASLILACQELDVNPGMETTLLIFPDGFKQFDPYLDLVDMAEALLADENYEGIYQVASFHPQYRFAGSPVQDAANYTNRSPYPMLHLLREESVEAALKKTVQPEKIPENNIAFARKKGTDFMKTLRDESFNP